MADKRQTIRDSGKGAIPGLHKIVGAMTSTYYLAYRTKAGRRRTVKLGREPGVDRALAREMAIKYLAIVVQGGDPQGEIEAARRAAREPEAEPAPERPTYLELAIEYRDERSAKKKWSANYHRDWRTIHDVYLLPSLGPKLVADLDYKTINRAHAKWSKRSRSQADKALTWLSGELRHAVKDPDRWGIRENYAAMVDHCGKRVRKVQFPAGDLRRIWEALDHFSARWPEETAAIRFLMFCPLRHQECLSLRWTDLHPEDGFVHVRESKKDTPWRPLSTHAFAVLDALPRSSEWCFPSRTHKHQRIDSLKYTWAAVRARAGRPDLHVHDFRKLAGYRLNDAKEDTFTVMAVLGHADPQAAKHYVQSRARAMVAVEEYGAGLLSDIAGVDHTASHCE